jgi:beta-galactosidase
MPPTLLHGGDYNPEQWAHVPGTWDEDMRLMKLAHVNSASVGIFSWAALEPEEGKFEFGWLDQVLDLLARNNARVILATPSGGKPNWLALKYPEVRRVNLQGVRDPQQRRHNHCWTSPVYREKVRIINTRLAERYRNFSNLHLWHISNEYGGYCYCDLCFAAFQQWLQHRYKTLDALNQAWWSTFWSHTFTGWDQVRTLDFSVQSMVIDFRRFMTDQCCSFIDNEAAPLREQTPHVRITTNLCGLDDDLDYREIAKHLDLVSWDNYPAWHGKGGEENLTETAAWQCMTHDLYRSLKHGEPFLLMESTPSQVNWQSVSRLKKPGVHRLASLSAVAHGSEGVCYFQWRKSRGSTEKWHGAVVDHVGHENTRVFREVAKLGEDLEKLGAVAGSRVEAQAAILFDWDNRWAIELTQHCQNAQKHYVQTVYKHYLPLWKRSIATDIIGGNDELSQYRLVIAPMLHMIRPGVAEAITRFVESGGIFVTTYLAGMVNETDLAFLTGFPGPLRKLLGIWVEETDALFEGQTEKIAAVDGNPLNLTGEYAARDYCDILHLEGAEAVATYASNFYQSTPAVTRHSFGKGHAYYVASRNDDRFLDDFVSAVAKEAKCSGPLNLNLPDGVTLTRRTNGRQSWFFLMNWTSIAQRISLPSEMQEVLTSQRTRSLTLPPYGVSVVEEAV